MRFENVFQGKTCVVTGAASGIGFALSEALLRAGALVVLADRDSEALEVAADRLAAHEGRSSHATVDVIDADQVAQLVVTAVSWRGRIDYMFNNAGIGGTLPIDHATLEHWQRIIDINLWGVIHGIQAVLPAMHRQGGGHIVNTGSISGVIPVPGQALYNTTKYAVVGLSESLRLELEPEGISVTVACPGPVVSRIWGLPIIGTRVESQPPPNAVSAEVAAQVILAGVARKAGIAILPARELWGRRLYRWFPRLAERNLRTIAHQRRRAAPEIARGTGRVRPGSRG